MKLCALLYDSLEDTHVTVDILKEMGYNERTVSLVQGMTKSKNTKYTDYIQGIIDSGDKELAW